MRILKDEVHCGRRSYIQCHKSFGARDYPGQGLRLRDRSPPTKAAHASPSMYNAVELRGIGRMAFNTLDDPRLNDLAVLSIDTSARRITCLGLQLLS